MDFSVLMQRLAVVPLLAVLTAASGYNVVPVQYVVLPPASPVVNGTEVQVTRGEPFLSSPVARPGSAAVAQRVEFVLAGRSIVLTPDMPLVSVLMAVWTPPSLADVSGIYCSEPQVTEKAAAAAEPRRYDKKVRACLVDSDGDRVAELAFMVGARLAEDQEPSAITPVQLNVAAPTPLPGISQIEMLMDQPNMFGGSVYWKVRLRVNGKMVGGWHFAHRGMYNGQTVYGGIEMFKNSLPANVEALGASFTIVSYDAPKARVVLHSGFAEGDLNSYYVGATIIPVIVR